MTEPMKYTDEQLKDFARRVIQDRAADIDFGYVGEMFMEEWADVPEDEFDKVKTAVHDLTMSAAVAVSWPDEQIAEIRARAGRCKMTPDHPGSMFTWQDSARDVPALLDEVERLRAELANTKQQCDDAMSGEATAEAERDAARAEVTRLRGVLKEATEEIAAGDDATGRESARALAAETERDRLAEQVNGDRLHAIIEAALVAYWCLERGKEPDQLDIAAAGSHAYMLVDALRHAGVPTGRAPVADAHGVREAVTEAVRALDGAEAGEPVDNRCVPYAALVGHQVEVLTMADESVTGLLVRCDGDARELHLVTPAGEQVIPWDLVAAVRPALKGTEAGR
ncbi:hypothetical protein [Actinomadura litoris]|uniref:hypothetical protein n=1 Tax=Actinomadura litoris TaxID=2678616 RepID=UPI001FA78A74|nr:hypothetical protein [Actinomadura litoris]